MGKERMAHIEQLTKQELAEQALLVMGMFESELRQTPEYIKALVDREFAPVEEGKYLGEVPLVFEKNGRVYRVETDQTFRSDPFRSGSEPVAEDRSMRITSHFTDETTLVVLSVNAWAQIGEGGQMEWTDGEAAVEYAPSKAERRTRTAKGLGACELMLEVGTLFGSMDLYLPQTHPSV